MIVLDVRIDKPHTRIDAIRIAGAGLAYFALVFSAGFILGSLRVPLIEPRLGRFWATVIEAPFLLLAMIVAAHVVADTFDMLGRRSALVAVGSFSLCLVFMTDAAVGLFLRQMSFGEQLLYLMTPAGVVYLLLLAIFAATPLIVDVWRRRAS